MKDVIERAIALRRSQMHEESRALLSDLLLDPALKSQAHLNIAWSFDSEGKENEAIPHYKECLKGHLSKEDRFNALLGLASTLRCLGHFEEASPYFQTLSDEYPDSEAVKPFFAMCLYNCGQPKKAVEMLLSTLLSTTNSDEILAYSTALSLYSEDIERTW